MKKYIEAFTAVIAALATMIATLQTVNIGEQKTNESHIIDAYEILLQNCKGEK